MRRGVTRSHLHIRKIILSAIGHWIGWGLAVKGQTEEGKGPVMWLLVSCRRELMRS